MDVIEILDQKSQQGTAADRTAYQAILWRQKEPLGGDAARLAKLMTSLALSRENVSRDAERVQRVIQARANLTAAEASRPEPGEVAAAHDALAKYLVESRKKCGEMQLALNALSLRNSDVETAGQRLAEVERDAADLLVDGPTVPDRLGVAQRSESSPSDPQALANARAAISNVRPYWGE